MQTQEPGPGSGVGVVTYGLDRSSLPSPEEAQPSKVRMRATSLPS